MTQKENEVNTMKKLSEMKTAKEYFDWYKEVSKNTPPLRGLVVQP